jgi:twitching motility protein PilT
MRDDKVQARFVVSKREVASCGAPREPQALSARGAPHEAALSPETDPLLRAGVIGVARTAPPAPAPPAPAAVAPAARPSPATFDLAVTGALEDLLRSARDANASDLHVVADRPPLLRIAGELVPRGAPLAASVVERFVMPIVPARCRRALEEHGACDFALEAPAVGRFRVNVTRQRTGLKACMRLIPAEIPTLASLGLPEDIKKATHHHQGLIVITGPTGHGKTSTLAAIVDVINSETTHHIITVEDPVEYVHPRKRAMMTQREVGTHTLSFANALKASLREDPDVIVCGELRDTETVRTALAASETGHLVLGTMNTPSAAKTIDRLVDLFSPAEQQQVRLTLGGGLRLIVSQRLLPTTDGRAMCAAAELLPGSVALWALIRDNKTFQIPSLQQRGKGFGIIRIDDSLADLVRTGRTTREAALAVAESPDELEAMLEGRGHAPLAAAQQQPKPQAQGILGRAGAMFGKRGG